MKCDVDAPGDRVDRRARDSELDRQPRMSRQNARDALQQVSSGGARWQCETDRSLKRISGGMELVLDSIQLGDDARATCVQDSTLVGQADPASGSVEQPGSRLGLESLKSPTDGVGR